MATGSEVGPSGTHPLCNRLYKCVKTANAKVYLPQAGGSELRDITNSFWTKNILKENDVIFILENDKSDEEGKSQWVKLLLKDKIYLFHDSWFENEDYFVLLDEIPL